MNRSLSSSQFVSRLTSTCALTAVLALSASSARADTQTTVIKPAINNLKKYSLGMAFPHYLLDNAMSKTVNTNGNVSYSDLKGNADLETYVQLLTMADLNAFPVLQVKDTRPDAKPDTKREDRSYELVFWLNAYNATVLKTVADAWPIAKIGEIKDFDSAKTHNIAGKNFSLREMRDKIAKFDARALFALSDGTKGGPLLQPSAYRYISINSSLERAVQTFVSDPRNFTINRINNKVMLNEFFKGINGYFSKKDDFKRLDGVRLVLSLYSTRAGDRNYFTTNDYVIDFQGADRNVNAQGR